MYKQVTAEDALAFIAPSSVRKLAGTHPQHPILINPSGEPLLLADGRPVGIMSSPIDGGKTIALVSGGKPLRGLDKEPLGFGLGGPQGKTLVDSHGSLLLGSGSLPLEVRRARQQGWSHGSGVALRLPGCPCGVLHAGRLMARV